MPTAQQQHARTSTLGTACPSRRKISASLQSLLRCQSWRLALHNPWAVLLHLAMASNQIGTESTSVVRASPQEVHMIFPHSRYHSLFQSKFWRQASKVAWTILGVPGKHCGMMLTYVLSAARGCYNSMKCPVCHQVKFWSV